MRVTKLLPAAIGGVLLFPQLTNAAGFAIKEQSTMSQGAAFAGSAAEAGDAGYMFFNPAQITKLKGNNVSASVSYIAPYVKADNIEASSRTSAPIQGTKSYYNDIGVASAVPNASFTHQISDNTFFGFGINAPFGMATHYDAGWAGRYHAIDSEISTENINPVIAYKVNNKLSVAGGLNLQRIHARLTSAADPTGGAAPSVTTDRIADLEGSNIEYGWNTGLLYEPTEDLTLGLAYRSKIKHSVGGDAIITTAAGVNTFRRFISKVTVPAQLSSGIAYKLNDKVTLLGEYDYTWWSDFEQLRMDYDDSLADTVVDEKWNDVSFIAIGLKYDYNEDWTFRTGVAYDNSPVENQYRTPRIPDVDRRWLSFGATYNFNSNVKLSSTYTKIIFDDSYINLSSADTGSLYRGNLSAHYRGTVDIFGLQLDVNF